MFKVEVLNSSCNSNKKNDKKGVCGFNAWPFPTDITIIKVASHMKYIDIKLLCPTTYGKSKTNLV